MQIEVYDIGYDGNCIYCIENVDNGKVYIGQTVNFNKRTRKHLSLLKRKKHWNKHLQEAYNNGQYFRIFPFELCAKSKMLEREVIWIEFFDSINKDKGYNKSKGGHYDYSAAVKGTNHLLGYKHTEEHRRNCSIARTGKKKPLSKKGLDAIRECRKKKIGTRSKGKSVKVTNPKTNEMQIFDSKREVEDFLGLKRDSLIHKFYYGRPRQILKTITFNNLIIER